MTTDPTVRFLTTAGVVEAARSRPDVCFSAGAVQVFASRDGEIPKGYAPISAGPRPGSLQADGVPVHIALTPAATKSALEMASRPKLLRGNVLATPVVLLGDLSCGEPGWQPLTPRSGGQLEADGVPVVLYVLGTRDRRALQFVRVGHFSAPLCASLGERDLPADAGRIVPAPGRGEWRIVPPASVEEQAAANG